MWGSFEVLADRRGSPLGCGVDLEVEGLTIVSEDHNEGHLGAPGGQRRSLFRKEDAEYQVDRDLPAGVDWWGRS